MRFRNCLRIDVTMIHCRLVKRLKEFFFLSQPYSLFITLKISFLFIFKILIYCKVIVTKFFCHKFKS